MSAIPSSDIDDAISDLKRRIIDVYPEAEFDVYTRDDPEGVRLRVMIDADDTDQVLDVVIDQLYEYQVEQGLPIYVVPVQTDERIAAWLEQRRAEDAAQSGAAS
jgi:hypothetical protein